MSTYAPKFRRIFLHFFDVHFFEMLGLHPLPPQLKKNVQFECSLAMRFAILCADEIYIPAASHIEADICHRIVSDFRDLFQFGLLNLIGGGLNISEFFEDKLRQYKRNSVQYCRYRDALGTQYLYPPFTARKASATIDISRAWHDTLTSGKAGNVLKETGFSAPKQFEKRWEYVPERLDGRAFVPEYVGPLLFHGSVPRTVLNRVRSLINASYFASFTRELCGGVVDNLVYLAAPDDIPSYGENIPYKELVDECRRRGLLKSILGLAPNQLLNLRAKSDWQDSLAAALARYQNTRTMRNLYGSPHMHGLEQATLGVITALPEEFVAVCQALECSEPVDVPGAGAGRKYAIARIRSKGGTDHFVAVALLTEAGNNPASIRATQMMEHCKKVKHVLMCGIAGAVPNPDIPSEHVRLGDIVVCDRGGVIQYDYVKRSQDFTEKRHAPRPPAASLLEATRLLKVAELKGQVPWKEHIEKCIDSLGKRWHRPSEESDKLLSSSGGHYVAHPPDPNRTPSEPRVFSGPIASANTLLKDPRLRDSLRDEFKVRAIEMEGSGIADATWNLERGYLVIRGTCDYCDSAKNDEWHNYASIVAAAYCRALIECLGPVD